MLVAGAVCGWKERLEARDVPSAGIGDRGWMDYGWGSSGGGKV